jgi:hypothetical protein
MATTDFPNYTDTLLRIKQTEVNIANSRILDMMNILLNVWKDLEEGDSDSACRAVFKLQKSLYCDSSEAFEEVVETMQRIWKETT